RRYPDGAIVEYDHAGHHALLSVPAGGSIVLTIGATTLTLTDGQAQIDTATLLVKASAKTRFETPILEATGTIQDLCDTSGKTMSGMRAAYNQHRHPENDAGGPTDEPIEKM
ncbi:MAG: hypothetical protein LBJ59_09035, partial [Zoogloeaceae bacterium]|nr:hypothetical protein [Zoogloeaceae bacterium]